MTPRSPIDRPVADEAKKLARSAISYLQGVADDVADGGPGAALAVVVGGAAAALLQSVATLCRDRIEWSCRRVNISPLRSSFVPKYDLDNQSTLVIQRPPHSRGLAANRLGSHKLAQADQQRIAVHIGIDPKD